MNEPLGLRFTGVSAGGNSFTNNTNKNLRILHLLEEDD
jgi:hypothetical protein